MTTFVDVRLPSLQAYDELAEEDQSYLTVFDGEFDLEADEIPRFAANVEQALCRRFPKAVITVDLINNTEAPWVHVAGADSLDREREIAWIARSIIVNEICKAISSDPFERSLKELREKLDHITKSLGGETPHESPVTPS